MDPFTKSILAIVASVSFVGLVLVSSLDQPLQGAIAVNMDEYTYFSNKQFQRDPLRTAINNNCPSGVEYCTTAGCACASRGE